MKGLISLMPSLCLSGEAPAAGGEDGPDTELAPLGDDSGDEAPATDVGDRGKLWLNAEYWMLTFTD